MIRLSPPVPLLAGWAGRTDGCLLNGLGVVVGLSWPPLWLLVHYSKTHADEAQPGAREAWPTWRMMFSGFFLDDDEFGRCRVEHRGARDRDNTI